MPGLLGIGTNRGYSMIGLGIGLGMSEFRINSGLFTPANISSLALWFDAADGNTKLQSSGGSLATANGDPIGQWSDKTSNAKHATQSDPLQKPRLITNSQNGLPGVEFPDSTDMLSLTRTTGLKHIFLVAKRYKTSYPNGVTALRDAIANDKDNVVLGQGGTGEFNISPSNSGGTFTGLSAWTTVSNGLAYLFELRSDGTNRTLVKDVATSTSSANVYDYSISEVGNYHLTTYKFAGVMYEICAFASALSAANIALMQGYLKSKWGTP